MAEGWIASLDEDSAVFAVTLRETREFIGVAGLTVTPRDAKAELAYWIGREYWGRGYATEAALAALRYGFEGLRLNRIYADCLARNTQSARILRKLGMSREGLLRQDAYHRGAYEDIELYAVLKGEYEGDPVADTGPPCNGPR
jgi:[ribosomal protein S5]-alanine N-acetyltransferase